MIGIDVSYAQGVIDWDKVKRSGVEFAIIRAGYGTWAVDDQFVRNITACNRLGIPCGVYWFSYARTVEQARQEAAKCLQIIAPYQVDMFVAWDWENDSCAKSVAAGVKPTMALVSAMGDAFLSAIDAAGYEAVNYSNIDYLQRYFSAALTAKWPVWVAQWPSNQAYRLPATAGKSQYKKAHLMWQFGLYTGVPGIKGVVDADVYYEEVDDVYNYAKFKEYQSKYEAERKKKAADDYAEGSCRKAVTAGIFSDGDHDGLVDNPQSPVLRQELAAVVDRLGLLDK